MKRRKNRSERRRVLSYLMTNLTRPCDGGCAQWPLCPFYKVGKASKLNPTGLSYPSDGLNRNVGQEHQCSEQCDVIDNGNFICIVNRRRS